MKVLVRLGSDLVVKSDRIRARFLDRLVRNIQNACDREKVRATIQREWSRLFVESEDEGVLSILERIFGVGSFSIIERECGAELEEIVAKGKDWYGEVVSHRRFAVRARRTGRHDYTSMDVQRQLGAALAPCSAGVDLQQPDVTVHVNIRDDRAQFFTGQTKGAGGLPLGVGGRALCLMSGGFDSAVAAWMLQKRGVWLDYLFCNLAGKSYERSVLAVTKFLADRWSYGVPARIHVVDFNPVVDALRARVKPSHVQVILKRLFYRAGEAVARDLDCCALVTGECVGQVSSQTLQNLATIDEATNVPVLRPLIGFDKEEIIAVSRRIGTYELSASIQEYCQLVPDRPVTACRLEAAHREERAVDPEVLTRALATRRTYDLAEMTSADLVTPFVYTAEVAPGAEVIDCRPRALYEAWHYPGAHNVELHELLQSFKGYDKSRTYVLYCPVGLQSAVAAEKMQAAGFEAYSFRGGVAALQNLAKPSE